MTYLCFSLLGMLEKGVIRLLGENERIRIFHQEFSQQLKDVLSLQQIGVSL